MHLLQISPYVVHPPHTGGDHRSHGLVTEFPSAGHHVTRYCQGGSPETYRNLDFRRTVEIEDGYVERRHFNPLHDVAMLPVLRGYPNLVASGALRLADDSLDDLLDDADIALVREPWQLPAVLDRADVPVVYSSHNVETERFRGAIPSPFARRAYDRVVALERRAVAEADAVVCTGERDAETYRREFDPGGPLVVAPNGTYERNVRAHDPDSAAAEKLRREYDIPTNATVCLFVGSSYGPNVEAARAAVDVVGEMTDRDPLTHLVVVGTVGKSLDATPSNVTVAGFVEAFEAHFDLADVALNPMLSGGGTNIKLVDYFARSMPVVSTPFGARGIDAVDGEEFLVTDLDDFPAAIDRLRDDPALRDRLGEAAQTLAAERYTWEAASRHLRDELEAIVA